jgi:hypothetical protein
MTKHHSKSNRASGLSEDTPPETLVTIGCFPLTTSALSEAVRATDVVFYLAQGIAPDHPVLLEFRALLTAHRECGSGRNLAENVDCATLEVAREEIRSKLGLEICAGFETLRFNAKMRRVLVIFYVSPTATAVTVELARETAFPPARSLPGQANGVNRGTSSD